MAGKAGSVLLVDDDRAVLLSLQALLDDDFDVVIAESPVAAKVACQRHDFDVLLVDFEMPGMSGIDLLRIARAQQQHLIAILMTGHPSHRDVRAADHDPAIYGVMIKPCDPTDLIATVRRAVGLAQLRRATLKMATRKTTKPLR